ncbi:unnamed protein product [Prunus armeniaca]
MRENEDLENLSKSVRKQLGFLQFPAVPAAEIGRDGKREAARSFWYRPRRVWWPDERTACQNVAGCAAVERRGERERERTEGFSLRFKLTTSLRTHLAVLYATV